MTMAKSTNFSDILDQPISEAEKPKPLPVGSYVCAVQTPPRMDASSQKGTKFVEFTLKVLKPSDDVDTDELKAQGGIGARTLRTTYYLTDGAKWRLRKFIEDCGVDFDEDATFSEGIASLSGAQVIAIVEHTPSKDGSQLFANVKDTMPV